MKFKATVYRRGRPAEVVEIIANDKTAALQKLRAQNCRVISLSADNFIPPLFAKTFALDIFTEQFLSLHKSGLDIAQSVEVLGKRHSSEQPVYEEIVSRLNEGLSLSDALNTLPHLFPPLYIAAVKSAERSSNLAETLERYLIYDRQLAALRRKVAGALTYPLVLLALGLSVLFFLLIYVVPRFSAIYDDADISLSLAATVLLRFGSFVNQHLWLAVGGVLAVGGALIMTLIHPLWRRQAIGALLKIPALGKKARLYQLSGFYRTLSMLLEGGLPVVQSLKVAAPLLTLTPPAAVGECIAKVSQGAAVSDCLPAAGLGDEIAVRLIRAGEKSGNLAAMMEKIAAFYDRDTELQIDRFTRLLEPLLMIGIGCLIGAIIMLMYIPIFDLAGTLQ